MFALLILGALSAEELPVYAFCYSTDRSDCEAILKGSEGQVKASKILSPDDLSLDGLIKDSNSYVMFLFVNNMTGNTQIDFSSIPNGASIMMMNPMSAFSSTAMKSFASLKTSEKLFRTFQAVNKMGTVNDDMSIEMPQSIVNIKTDTSKKYEFLIVMGCHIKFDKPVLAKTLALLDKSTLEGTGRVRIDADVLMTTNTNYEYLRGKISARHMSITSMLPVFLTKTHFTKNDWTISFQPIIAPVQFNCTVLYEDVRGQLSVLMIPLPQIGDFTIELESAPGGGLRRGINISVLLEGDLPMMTSSAKATVKFTGDWTNVEMKDIMNLSPGDGFDMVYDSIPPTVKAQVGADISSYKFDDDGSNLGIIIGASVGGVAAVCIIAGLAVFFIKRKGGSDSGSGKIHP